VARTSSGQGVRLKWTSKANAFWEGWGILILDLSPNPSRNGEGSNSGPDELGPGG